MTPCVYGSAAFSLESIADETMAGLTVLLLAPCVCRCNYAAWPLSVQWTQLVPVLPRESLMLSCVDVERCPDQLVPVLPRESLMLSCVDVEVCPD